VRPVGRDLKMGAAISHFFCQCSQPGINFASAPPPCAEFDLPLHALRAADNCLFCDCGKQHQVVILSGCKSFDMVGLSQLERILPEMHDLSVGLFPRLPSIHRIPSNSSHPSGIDVAPPPRCVQTLPVENLAHVNNSEISPTAFRLSTARSWTRTIWQTHVSIKRHALAHTPPIPAPHKTVA
jgi:hypothetical protein